MTGDIILGITNLVIISSSGRAALPDMCLGPPVLASNSTPLVQQSCPSGDARQLFFGSSYMEQSVASVVRQRCSDAFELGFESPTSLQYTSREATADFSVPMSLMVHGVVQRRRFCWKQVDMN